MAGDKGRKSRSDDLLDWFTISYRTIYLVAGSVVAVVAATGGYYYVKNQPVSASTEATPAPVATTTARFTSIEGNVKVRAVGSFEWVTADKDVILKRGDLVKTGSASTSEITFFDGTVVHVRPESLITIEETAKTYNVSRAHLMKVVNILTRTGYLKGVRGRTGGVTLAKPPEAINLGAVVRATEPDFALVECFATGNQCTITKRCQLPEVLNEALNAFIHTLDRYTLADIVLTKRDFVRPKGSVRETRGPHFTVEGRNG